MLLSHIEISLAWGGRLTPLLCPLRGGGAATFAPTVCPFLSPVAGIPPSATSQTLPPNASPLLLALLRRLKPRRDFSRLERNKDVPFNPVLYVDQ
jgi:hypothetical protein